ncbi:MAG: heavy metal sensor histidine kinase [Betaproteobacteria bacterium]|nr:heavy metal sensor histidine kinase [Betaproteobacteria bacterium]
MASAGAPVSLTARLTVGFVTVLVTAHVGICLYLDYTFQEEFSTEDRRELAGNAAFVRQILAEQRSFEELRANPQRLLDAKTLHQRLSFVFSDSRGHTIESSYEARSLADSVWARARTSERAGEPMGTLTHEGRIWRALVASGALGDAEHTPIAIMLALDVTERENFARRYRSRLVVAAVVAAVIAGLVGFPLVRGALVPLDAMARRAGEISASRLDERLPVDGVPRELQELSMAFNHALERLQDSFRRLSQFSSELAHELRTPIGNLMGEAQVALRRVRTAPEYQAVLASAVEECEWFGRMIDAMLFLARADNAQTALHRKLLDGRQEVLHVAEYYEGLLAEHGLELCIEGNAAIWADPELLRQALSNLVINAIGHTHRGEAIMVSFALAPDASVLVEVSNPGSGIPANVLSRVFDRFFRMDEARGGSERGSGLGLAIVRSIMQLHGGSASVRSTPEGPTVFTLCFPSEAGVQAAAMGVSVGSLPQRRELGASPS